MTERMTAAQFKAVQPRARSKRGKPKRREEVLHEQVAKWLDEHLIDAEWHTIRQETRAFDEARKGKKTGVKPGVSDIVVIDAGRYLAVELKAPKGPNGERPGYPSKHQKDWAERLEKAGGKYAVCRSIEDVRAALEDWGVDLLPTYRGRT